MRNFFISYLLLSFVVFFLLYFQITNSFQQRYFPCLSRRYLIQNSNGNEADNLVIQDIKTVNYVGKEKHIEILSYIRSIEDMIHHYQSIIPSADDVERININEDKSPEMYHRLEDTKPLLKDIELLSSILGEVIKREDEEIYKLYETFSKHALSRSSGDMDALGRMITCSMDISPELCLGVVRAFTVTLNLINAAEVHHRVRLLRNNDIISNRLSPLPCIPDSIGGTLSDLLHQQHDSKDIYNKLLEQKVDIVLTAHPTEVNRRTILRKYRRVSEILAVLDRADMTSYEHHEALTLLNREIASLWGSDEIRRLKPTPQQEAYGGIAIIESVLWDAVPQYFRKLDLQLQLSLNKTLPLNAVPIKFSSWIAGDRDGNPHVTPLVTKEVVLTQRLQAAKLLLADINTLYSELAICKGFSLQMIMLAKAIKISTDRRELYRRVLGHIRKRLIATITSCEKALLSLSIPSPHDLPIINSNFIDINVKSESIADSHDVIVDSSVYNIESIETNSTYEKMIGYSSEPFHRSSQLLDILYVLHDSLTTNGYPDVANGLLVDVIRRVNVFGLTLVPLDIRQESSRHVLTLDAITKYLGIGSFAQWDEDTKINWLSVELSGKRPLFNTQDINKIFDTNHEVLDTLKTFETLSELNPESLGAYVISQAKAASDVLAVMLLQKQFGMISNSIEGNYKMMRVVPLFETLNDLNNSGDILRRLFGIPIYLALTNRRQEVMVGYSDSAKDAGKLAASWAQYESQVAMVIIAKEFNVKLTFFHGKGGTVGRGGNPALFRAVLSHPPDTISGRFRVTEQGEMITQNFGSVNIAERTLDIYTAAVLSEQFQKVAAPKQRWIDIMKHLSVVSCKQYRSLLIENSFINYFRLATPELELSRLNIGSRPVKRHANGGIESLRAIPWTFSWSQNRLNMPAWMGVGEALDAEDDKVSSSYTISDLQEMYQHWPFFREMIDLIAMTISKTDLAISSNNELQLIKYFISDNALDISSEDLLKLGEQLRGDLLKTTRAILRVSNCNDLSSNFKLLKVSMSVRYPYIDPLNVLQTEIIRRLRLSALNKTQLISSKDLKYLEDALVVSINGIAQGLKNSG